MPMIECPECKEKISDKATACPNCGYPLQQSRTVSLNDILIGGRWQARSQSLAGQGLIITFMLNGRFIGQLIGMGYDTPPQQVNGKWQVVESQLFLEYGYTQHVQFGYAVQVVPTSTHMQIQITQGSESKLLGVDQTARLWEWDRVN